MLLQAAALLVLVAGNGSFAPALAAAVVLGIGTALVYPTLLAAVSDAVAPGERARASGVYRFWRDSGLVAGALLAGVGADAFGAGPTLTVVAGLTALSGLAFLRPPSQKGELHDASDRLSLRPSPRGR
jgi:MFS family permease